MKIGIVSTLHGRPRLTRLFLEYYAALKNEHNLELLAVGSEASNPYKVRGWSYIHAPNSPLTNKHNAGARALMNGVDCIINIPSDDFFTPGYFDFVRAAIESGADFIRFESIYFGCLATGDALYGRQLFHGAGAVIAKSLLNKINWHPWEPDHDTPTDHFLVQRCEGRAEKPLIVPDILDCGFSAIDLKVPGQSLNSFEKLRKGLAHQQDADLAQVMQSFPSIRGEVLAWGQPAKRTRIKKEAPPVISDRQRIELDKLLKKSKTDGGKIEIYWRGEHLKMRRNVTAESFSV